MEIERRNYLIFLTLTILYAAMIFVLSASSSPPGSEEGKAAIPYFSRIAHTVLYFGFAFCVFHTLEYYPEELSVDPYLLTFVVTLLYGISDEIHQYFVPYRTFSVIDIFFDALGGSLLLAVMYFVRRHRSKLF